MDLWILIVVLIGFTLQLGGLAYIIRTSNHIAALQAAMLKVVMREQ
jgi:hypothetical protein